MCAEELGRWDALVVVSGDGLMHEVRVQLEDALRAWRGFLD